MRDEENEHSLEIELPFVYHLFGPSVKVVLIMVGAVSSSYKAKIASYFLSFLPLFSQSAGAIPPRPQNGLRDQLGLLPLGLQLRFSLLQGPLEADLAEHRGAGQARRGADRAAVGRRLRLVHRRDGQHDLRPQLHRDFPADAGAERPADVDDDAAVRTEQSRGEHGGQQRELLRAEDGAASVACLLHKHGRCGILGSRAARSRD